MVGCIEVVVGETIDTREIYSLQARIRNKSDIDHTINPLASETFYIS